MARSNLLEINNLIVSFENPQGELNAVKGVSLSLEKGSTLALVGESGCGKTVLCKSMLKLLCEKGRIRGGQVIFDGTDLTPLSEKDIRAYRGKGIAMVFQDPDAVLDPAFSVGEQIAEVLRIHEGLSRKDAAARATTLMQQVQIPDASERYHQRPYQFSGGMRQRIVIAMALAGNPALLIADEPTTALDQQTQQEILKLLKRVRRETGAAMLFITHDLSLVEEMAEDVAIMKNGVIVEKGPVEKVFSAPEHPYTRKLLGYLDYSKGRGHRHRSRSSGQTSEHGEKTADCCSGAHDGVPLLSVDNLCKRFSVGRSGTMRVFEDFSMELYRGEIVGLVGPSGCGKTTLARCIMGLEPPDAGKISTGGSREGASAGTADIQMIFQDSATAFNDRMKVKEIIEEPLLIRRKLGNGRKKKPSSGPSFQSSLEEDASRKSQVGGAVERMKEAVRAAMESVELDYEAYADRKPGELSGGQRQRAAIARALITDPDIIIADEPLTGLDVSAQAQIAHLFRKLADERGLAVLFIAHDLPMVEHISDRVIKMKICKKM